MLEKIFEASNPSLDINIASQLIESLKGLQSQVSNIQDNVSKSQSDFSTNFSLKFMEFKREYIEDLKMILSTNASEKLAPIIKEYNESLLDKTRILIGEVIPKTQESLSKNIENSIKTLHSSIQQDTTSLMKNTINKETLDDFIESLEEKFSKTIVSSQSIFNSIVSTSETRLGTRLSEIKDISKTNSLDQTQLQKNIGELLKKMENSSSKGNISENILFNVLHSLYPTAQIDSVGTTKETGDIMLIRKDKPTILFENKNYNKNTPQEEVKKFLRDVELQNCSGIMLAQHYGITNKDNFEIEMNNSNVLVYLHRVEYDADKIRAAVDIIDHFKSKIGDMEKVGGNAIHIEKEILDDINKECQLFIANKLAHIKTIKDFQQKLLAQVEDMKIPSLEHFLSKMYASSSSKDDVCEYCDYNAKNARALAAHYRGCAQKKQFELTNNVVST
jgi:ATP phosphoribosyltransferase